MYVRKKQWINGSSPHFQSLAYLVLFGDDVSFKLLCVCTEIVQLRTETVAVRRSFALSQPLALHRQVTEHAQAVADLHLQLLHNTRQLTLRLHRQVTEHAQAVADLNIMAHRVAELSLTPGIV